jgi:hypothetical protein
MAKSEMTVARNEFLYSDVGGAYEGEETAPK